MHDRFFPRDSARFPAPVIRLVAALLAGALMVLFALMGLASHHSDSARAAPAIRYVSPAGTDTGDCSSAASPCRTLQYAVDQSNPGDEIRVATGIYTDITARHEVTQIVYISLPLTLIGGFSPDFTIRDPDAYPTILDPQGQTRAIFIRGLFSVTIDGFRFVNGAGISQGGAMRVISASLYLRNVHFEHNRTTSLPFFDNPLGGALFVNGAFLVSIENSVFAYNWTGISGGGSWIGADRIIIRRTQWYGNRAAAASAASVSGNEIHVMESIFYSNSSSFAGSIGIHGNKITIENSIFTSNTSDYGASIVAGAPEAILINNILAHNISQRGGAFSLFTGTAHLIHNTFFNNQNAAIDAFGGTLYLTNTIIASHTVGITRTTPPNPIYVFTDSVLWHNVDRVASDITGIVRQRDRHGDPRFVNPEAMDFHLQPGSAAINTGIPTWVNRDIDGDLRPQSIMPDIGADEVPGIPIFSHYLPLILKEFR